jgi:hypothetical protein
VNRLCVFNWSIQFESDSHFRIKRETEFSDCDLVEVIDVLLKIRKVLNMKIYMMAEGGNDLQKATMKLRRFKILILIFPSSSFKQPVLGTEVRNNLWLFWENRKNQVSAYRLNSTCYQTSAHPQ